MGSIAAGDGNIVNGGFLLTAGGDNTSTTCNGVLSGVGGLEKDGSGSYDFSGSEHFLGRQRSVPERASKRNIIGQYGCDQLRNLRCGCE